MIADSRHFVDVGQSIAHRGTRVPHQIAIAPPPEKKLPTQLTREGEESRSDADPERSRMRDR